METHPKGKQARILLSSVFGPYAQDDEFGSRSINPMELYHNQVTRAQGAFSLRMFHRSWGIMMIQSNVSAPCTVLDFPTRDDFRRELTENQYDIVGISSIIVNIGKVKEMCRMVREFSPGSQIVVGGHVAAIPGVEQMIDADHIVKGEGVSWMRRYLGEDPTAPIKHPEIVSGINTGMMGIRLPNRKGATAATIIPSVGCPLGCNFCTTSAFFGGKGKFINFYNTGDELFEVMLKMEQNMKVTTFFMMDENFLLHKKRSMRLLELMREHDKSWGLAVFSSANALKQYTMQELAELGVSWVWMGLESPKSTYTKLNGTDTHKLIRELHAHGIRVLGSTIVGLEHHTPENIQDEIEYAVEHGTDFHQFMLYTPVPGTPLYKQIESEGRLLPDVDFADIHGQHKFNFQHAAISRDQSKRFLDWAFWRDFEKNGPSLYRMCKTFFEGWKRYKDFPDKRVVRRFADELMVVSTGYNATLWVMEKKFKTINPEVAKQIHALRKEIEKEFGLRAKLTRMALAPVLWWTTNREERQLSLGKTYEPPTVIERTNWAGTSEMDLEPEACGIPDAVTA